MTHSLRKIFYSLFSHLNTRLFAYQACTGAVLGATTLTGLIPDAFEAMDTVARELVGFIPAVSFNANASRAAVGQQVKSFVAPAGTGENVTPAALPPDTGDQTIDNRYVTITKARAYPFRWTGEEQVGANFGPGYRNIRADQIAQAIRGLVNEFEADIAALALKASRAYGTASTLPFATNLSDPAQLRKILVDNGAPPTDLQLVINTSAGAALRTLAQLTKANEAADTTLLRQGILLPLHNLDIRESAAVVNPAIGGANGAYTTTAAGFLVGVTSIPLITGAGTILAGDLVVVAGDANRYVVVTGIAAPGTIVIQNPGLRKAIVGATGVTVVAKSARNLAFHRSAIVAVARAPAIPEEGDSAADRMVLTDPRSGLSIEFSMYLQYRRVRYEAALAWGQEMMKPEFSAVLLGEI